MNSVGDHNQIHNLHICIINEFLKECQAIVI